MAAMVGTTGLPLYSGMPVYDDVLQSRYCSCQRGSLHAAYRSTTIVPMIAPKHGHFLTANSAVTSGARREDHRLLTGSGRYVADWNTPGLAHGVVVRSPVAHARIRGVDATAASGAPGVLEVLLPDDPEVAALGTIPWEMPPPDADEMSKGPLQPVLARGTARYLGEPIAFVVAETQAQAQDAAELVDIHYETLPCVTEPDSAAVPDAPLLWPDYPGNVYFRFHKGDEEVVAKAFAEAAHVAELSVRNNRLSANPMEPRVYAGEWDQTTGRWTLRVAAGKPHPLKRIIAGSILGIDADRIRVIVEDVGGGFGAKNQVYPEQVLVMLAARRVGRPVRWLASRCEMMISDAQGRDQVSTAALAVAADGRFLAVRATIFAALGAYFAPRGLVSPIAGGRTLPGVYDIPAASIDVQAMFTNTVPTAPYRGAGQPEIMFLIERLVDRAARMLGISPVEIRRRNMIAPEALPYTNAFGITYDTGDFPANLARAREFADWDGFEARREEARGRQRLRGIGLSSTIEACGMHVDEQALVRMASDGKSEVLIGTMSNGQGHETVYAQLVAEALGCAASDVTVVQGDTDRIATGNGTGASRSLTVGGSALLLACRDVVEQGCVAAAELLQADPAAVEPCPGGFRVRGTERMATWDTVAGHRGGLTAEHRFNPDNYTFPSGCHVCEVEIDPETGVVALEAYTMVHDVGRAINVSVVAGQLEGGVTQGIGQALLEQVRYDVDGQVITGSFLDYAMPHADEIPSFRLELSGIPSVVNPLGAKSVGEAGPTAAPPAVIIAVLDALAPLGVDHIEMPATPESVWRAIRSANMP